MRVKGSWRPNITEIFGPRSYGRHRCVFLVLYGCSTEHWESTLRGAGFSYYNASMSVCNYTACHQLYSPVCALACLNSSALYYLQTPTRWYGHASTTTSDILGAGMCHFRFLWNGLCEPHRAEITVIQFRGHSLPVRQSMRV